MAYTTCGKQECIQDFGKLNVREINHYNDLELDERIRLKRNTICFHPDREGSSARLL
jgi:hypothetical protein